MAATRVTVPVRFYDDHVDRDCLAGVVVKRTARTVTVDLDVAAWADLLSDADYYSDARAFDACYSGLVASARATARIMRAVV